MTRRDVLTRAVAFGGSALVLGRRTAAGASCGNPFDDAVLLGTVAFTGEGGPLDVAFGSGLDGRRYTDLSTIGSANLMTSNDRHFVRTRSPGLTEPSARWRIAVSGLVREPLSLSLEALAPKVTAGLGPFVMECSGNGAFAAFGMLSAACWSGVPLVDVLAMVDVLPAATRVLVSGVDGAAQSLTGTSTHGASWIFTLAELEQAGAFLATGMNGVSLSPDHGFPVRLMVPNWYGCTCIKWVDALELVDDGAPATSQMREFASRTHQQGEPALAREYRSATIDQAAMPVRIEKWRRADGIVYRVVGIMWGGYRVTDKLSIRFAPGQDDEPVSVCPRQSTNQTWTVWSHPWRPATAGSYAITMSIDDPSIPSRRLDAGFYRRTVDISEI